MIDRTLNNRYTIMEAVGSGGVATVYRAYDKILDRSVAVKMLRDDVGEKNDDFREFITRFRMEAQSVAKLSHPNIVTMYDVGNEDNVDYIVMEYVAGETLKKKIDREGALAQQQSLKIVREIAEALEHAHQNHLVHCDIKPHNILITSTGRVKVTDFGIAQAATTTAQHTNAGFIMGSAPYLSPEQARGQMPDARSDLYSLGIVLYEMLTGRVPFEGKDPAAVAMKQIQEMPIPPSKRYNTILPFAEAIVMKALEKSPQNRYQTMGEMIVDLKTAEAYLMDDGRKQSDSECPTMVLKPITDEQLEDTSSDNDGDEHGTAGSGKSKKKWIFTIIAVMIVTVLAGVFFAYGKFWSTAEVVVPNVVGKTVADADHILQEHKLRVSLTERFDDNVAAGIIISQTPAADSKVKEDRMISLYVSKGAEITVVPDVRTMTLREAELMLRNEGFVIGNIEEVASDEPADTVVDQNPRSPAQIHKSQKIDLIVSRAEKVIELPDFTGSSLSSAKKQLADLNLKQGSVDEETSSEPKGTILKQEPKGGAEVAVGSSIDFIVSKGSDEKKVSKIQFTVPDGESKQVVQIIVTDESGREIVYERTHNEGDRINKRISGYGNVRVQVYVNGSLAQEDYL